LTKAVAHTFGRVAPLVSTAKNYKNAVSTKTMIEMFWSYLLVSLGNIISYTFWIGLVLSWM